MNIAEYIENINQRYKLGNATEHTFRGDLQTLIESLVPTIRATNEPKRQSCGAPDYILTKKDIPVGFIEAKDIGDKDLEGAKKTGNKEQFDRYKLSLGNLIFTDYLNFLLYRDGEFVTKIAIAELVFPSSGLGGQFPSTGGVPAGRGGIIIPLPQNFSTFENLIKDFCTHAGQTIKSSKKLAEMMAGKARLLSEIIEKALTSDEEKQEDSTLKDQMTAFREILIHDITPKGFADVYAQTIAYGMFAARLHDPTLPTFSRQEAAELIPRSNPFLRKLFGYIAGPDIDDRIKWIVDSLVEIFLACNVEEILKNYGKSTKMEDPIIHFYETFLSEYDPKLRKARGVWYTPAPVVNFIVRAVDDILKTEFNLLQGIADNSKIKIKVDYQGKKIEQEVHRVQMLDPATGTGTFLAEVVKLIHKKFEGQQGIWSNYVETHLLPRLNGFELLMASYAMAHLKLDLLLTETGYKPTRDQRFRVYLTNSLEESHPDTGTLFANWLSTEANEANHIKRDTPVMVVMGNPPYSVSSSNKSEWIEKLTADYKKNLNERNIQPLSDDYIKFIRFGQHFIDKNGSGILAYISNNSFIDGIIHRQMRKKLLESFDSIYILDLHGNAKKKEICPDGSPDQNVFDIMQGVSINLFVKTGKKKKNELGQVFQFDLHGKREFKYEFLFENKLSSIDWNKFLIKAPNYSFIEKNVEDDLSYNNGFNLSELFIQNSSGIETRKDYLVIAFEEVVLRKVIEDFRTLSQEDISHKYKVNNDSRDWKIEWAKIDILANNPTIENILQKPFDNRKIIYTGKTKGINGYPMYNNFKHFLNKDNLGLISKRGRLLGSNNEFSHIAITKKITDKNFLADQSYIFPLYLYPETTTQQTIEPATTRTPNLNAAIVNQIAEKLGLTFTAEKNSPPPEGCPQGGVVNSLPEACPQGEVVNTSPEACPQGGVVNSSPEACPQGGVVNSSPEGCPQGGVAKSSPMQQSPQGGVDNKSSDPILCTINNIPIRRNHIENLPCNHALSQRAKEKRKAGILSEVLFWLQVHKGAFHKIDFDRQRIIGNYIVDFYVKALGLVVEIDGSSHDTKVEYDRKRQQYLENLGLKVYRIADGDVKMNLGIVMAELERYIVEEYGEKTTPSATGGHPSGGGEFAPIDILDYIYAVLHSPTYREKYKEFLKIDFPRVPYPKDVDTFWQLVKLGSEIRQIHLLESPTVDKYITQYPVDGNNLVTKPSFQNSPSPEGCPQLADGVPNSPSPEGCLQLADGVPNSPSPEGCPQLADGVSNSPPPEGCPQGGVANPPSIYNSGKVYINDSQYFDNVPKIAWDFYIGGYQPAQKWLKDRKGRELEYDEILHYQKIIVALTETDRLMKEIDKIEIE